MLGFAVDAEQRGVLAADAQHVRLSVRGDLEVVVRDPAAERFHHGLAARPDTRCDLLRIHPAILDWPRMTVRALLLDFNGTLSEDEPLLFGIFEDLFASAGKPITEAEYYDQLAGLSDPEVVEAWLGKPEPALVARKIQLYLERSADGHTYLVGRPAGGAGSRRAVVVAIVSGSARREIEPVVAAAGLSSSIAELVAAEDVEHGKPAPDGYLQMLELLGLDRRGGRSRRLRGGNRRSQGGGPPLLRRLRNAPADRLAAADGIVERLDPDFVAAGAGVGFSRAERQRARAADRGRLDRHGRRRVHGHAGPADRQAPSRRSFFLDGRSPGTGSRAATTCSRSRWRWTRCPATRSRAGSADTATSAAPDLATLRRIPWLEGTALVLGDVHWHDGSPVAPSPRQVLEAAGRAGARRRVRADVRLGARVLPVQGDLRGGAREALPRPDAVGAVHPRLPRARVQLRRAVHPPDPQRDAGRRDPGRDVEGRGLARPARDQLPLRRRADDGRQPRRSTRTARRRSRT